MAASSGSTQTYYSNPTFGGRETEDSIGFGIGEVLDNNAWEEVTKQVSKGLTGNRAVEVFGPVFW